MEPLERPYLDKSEFSCLRTACGGYTTINQQLKILVWNDIGTIWKFLIDRNRNRNGLGVFYITRVLEVLLIGFPSCTDRGCSFY